MVFIIYIGLMGNDAVDTLVRMSSTEMSLSNLSDFFGCVLVFLCLPSFIANNIAFDFFF